MDRLTCRRPSLSTTPRRRVVSNVLAVPITALVALSGGGYGVYVVAASTSVRTLVGVTPGLFATTLVQVSSPGLHAGDRVIVPAS